MKITKINGNVNIGSNIHITIPKSNNDNFKFLLIGKLRIIPKTIKKIVVIK